MPTQVLKKDRVDLQAVRLSLMELSDSTSLTIVEDNNGTQGAAVLVVTILSVTGL